MQVVEKCSLLWWLGNPQKGCMEKRAISGIILIRDALRDSSQYGQKGRKGGSGKAKKHFPDFIAKKLWKNFGEGCLYAEKEETGE